jgi:RHS repeat-associated protein
VLDGEEEMSFVVHAQPVVMVTCSELIIEELPDLVDRVAPWLSELGNTVHRTGSTPNNFLYRGEQFDTDLGLYYLRARYYNAASGRFLSTDPDPGNVGDPVTLQRYPYVRHDPISRIDPTGLDDEIEEGALIENVSANEETLSEIKQVSERVNCILQITADVLALVPTPDSQDKNKSSQFSPFSIASVVVNANDCNAEKRFTPDQEALVDLAKKAKKTGVTPEQLTC